VIGMADRTEEIEIRLLLEALFQKYHFDFRGCAMASLKRRLKRGREHLGFATISAMQDRLLHDSTMLPKLLGFLTVQVSEILSNVRASTAERTRVRREGCRRRNSTRWLDIRLFGSIRLNRLNSPRSQTSRPPRPP
jgi:hypothetical protein